MKYTTNKNLKLPEYTDVADVADLNENFEAIDEHMGETVTSENGAHGFRYDEENQKLEAKTSTGEWEEISLGADVSGVTATADKVLAGSKFVTADGVLTDGTMEKGLKVASGSASLSSSGTGPISVTITGHGIVAKYVLLNFVITRASRSTGGIYWFYDFTKNTTVYYPGYNYNSSLSNVLYQESVYSSTYTNDSDTISFTAANCQGGIMTVSSCLVIGE